MVTVTGSLSVTLPESSVARAVRSWRPVSAPLQSKAKGALVFSPMTTLSERNSTFAIVPSSSVAFTVKWTFSGGVMSAPATGEVSVTAGAAFTVFEIPGVGAAASQLAGSSAKLVPLGR